MKGFRLHICQQTLIEAKGSYRATENNTELDRWKNRVGFLLQLAGNSAPLSDINSEVSSEGGSVLPFSTALAEMSKTKYIKNTLTDITCEELEKYIF